MTEQTTTNNFSSTWEWLSKLWCIDIIGYYSSMRMNMLTCIRTVINFKKNMLNNKAKCKGLLIVSQFMWKLSTGKTNLWWEKMLWGEVILKRNTKFLIDWNFLYLDCGSLQRFYMYIYCCCLVTKSCSTLMTPCTGSPPGSSVMGFPRQEYWNGSPFPSPGDLPSPGIKPTSPALQRDSLLLCHRGSPMCIHTQTHIYDFGWIRIIKLWWNVHKIWNRS